MKYVQKEKNMLIFFLILVIILMLIFFLEELVSLRNRQKEFAEAKKTSSIQATNNNTDDINDVKTEKIISTYKGYPVIAKLKIPKINLETDVLSEYSEEALKVSVTKFYGGFPNEVGNFCISGHNYINSNMFRNLKKLDIGDEIFLVDGIYGVVKYEVYDILTVNPNETDCLSQKTNGKVELTLITCTSDSKKRIIVKAEKSQ